MILLAGALLLVALATRRVETGGPPGTTPATATPGPPDRVEFAGKGLAVARPDGWTAQRSGRVVRLRSGDGRTVVAIRVLPRRVSRTEARLVGERAIRAGFDGARLISRRPTTVSGGRATAAEMVARGREGALVDVLVLGARSRWRTYGLTAISARPRRDEQVRDLGTLLAGIEFLRPRGRG